MRGLILKDLDLAGNGRKLGRNVIFDTANATRLASHLYALTVGDLSSKNDGDEIEEMKTMIKRYSSFQKHVPGSSPDPEGYTIVLTGSTGSLGAHILALLLARSEVRNVYCLVRGENPQERVLEALRQRDLDVPDTTRLVALTSDLGRKDLGLSPEIFDKLKSETTSIIHRYVSSSCCSPQDLFKSALLYYEGWFASIVLFHVPVARSPPRDVAQNQSKEILVCIVPLDLFCNACWSY